MIAQTSLCSARRTSGATPSSVTTLPVSESWPECLAGLMQCHWLLQLKPGTHFVSSVLIQWLIVGITVCRCTYLVISVLSRKLPGVTKVRLGVERWPQLSEAVRVLILFPHTPEHLLWAPLRCKSWCFGRERHVNAWLPHKIHSFEGAHGVPGRNMLFIVVGDPQLGSLSVGLPGDSAFNKASQPADKFLDSQFRK